MDFWVIFGSKKLENYFYFDFACGNGTGHPSIYYIRGHHSWIMNQKFKTSFLFKEEQPYGKEYVKKFWLFSKSSP